MDKIAKGHIYQIIALQWFIIGEVSQPHSWFSQLAFCYAAVYALAGIYLYIRSDRS